MTDLTMGGLAEIQRLIVRHAGRGVTRTPLPGVSVMASTTTTPPMDSVARPSLALVAGGAKRTVVGGRVAECATGEYLIVSLAVPVTAHISRADADEPFLAFGLELRPELIAGLVLDAAHDAAASSRDAAAVVDRADGDLLDAVTRLLRLLDRPQARDVLAPLYEREVLWRLLSGSHGGLLWEIGLADSRLSRIARAAARLRRDHALPLRVDDLAAAVHMSSSSFHRQFRAATGMTPLEYQKRIRLQHARARLLADPHDIAGIARSVGYNSPSQFSREYRRLYGAPPSREHAIRVTLTGAGDRLIK